MSEVKVEQLGKSIGGSLGAEATSRFLSSFLEATHEALSAGKEVTLDGLGTLAVGGEDGQPLPASYAANIVADVAAKSGVSDPQGVGKMLQGLSSAIRKEILDGRKVVLSDLGTFEIREEAPQIEKQARGHRIIKPAATKFRFHSTQHFSTPAGEGGLIFVASEDFKKKVEQFRSSTIMLVVPERDFFVKTLEYYFENAGWEIEVIESIDDAVAHLSTGKAYLVLVDAGMPEYQKFVAGLKMRRETNAVPLILLFPGEDEFRKVTDLTILGDENLVQPFEFRKLLDAADAEIMRAAEEQLIFLQQITMQLPTEEGQTDALVEKVQALFEESGLDAEAQVAISAAFREAVLNASQHGNKYDANKKIEVQYLLDRDKVTLVVRDEGEGFDHGQYVVKGQSRAAVDAARERHQQGRMGGLGIMLMLRCCDRLEYNDKGNQISLVKNIQPSE